MRYNELVDRDVHALFAQATTAVGAAELKARWDGLPEPARRYLRFAIPDDAPAIRTARLRHEGFFRTKPDQPWMPITGEQYFTAAAPGFVWAARVAAMPLVWIVARDCLLDGRGHMLVKVESIFTIADARGPEIDQGARLRWLVEAAWFPYAFAGDAIEWQPVDAHSARVTLRDQVLPVSAVVEIDADGRLASLRAERYRDLGGGKAALSRWGGRYEAYRDFGGFRVPTSVDVTWDLEEGPFTYARFRVTTIEYNVDERWPG